jgi:Fur family ferric uptake transcriptional regulator
MTDDGLERVPVSQSPQQRFDEYLQSKGMRNTEQRKLLVDHVFSRHEHFDAETLIDQLPRKGNPGYVSRPTVYRTLNEFVDAGLLRKFELDGRAVYEHDYGYPQHDHLYCEQSQELAEFQSDELLELIKKIAAENDFQVHSHRLIIYGISKEGRQSRTKRKRRKQDLI